jgi:hypothetical protein
LLIAEYGSLLENAREAEVDDDDDDEGEDGEDGEVRFVKT